MSRRPTSASNGDADQLAEGSLSWDEVLQRTAWKVADRLGWETTYAAQFATLTRLQVDAFVTSDRQLARAASGVVKTATAEVLRTA